MTELRFPKAKSTNGKAKRLLYALYQHEQNDLPSYDRLTLEHVLPESPEHVIGWGPHFDNDNHERYSLMPGNMTLLSPSDNKGTATFNQSFGNKKWNVPKQYHPSQPRNCQQRKMDTGHCQQTATPASQDSMRGMETNWQTDQITATQYE